MNIQALNDATAYIKGSPIYNPEQVNQKKLAWNKMDEQWINNIKESNNFWFTGYVYNPQDFNLQEQSRMPLILSLRDRLLQFGGEQACMPVIEPDISEIMSRGQFWYGDIITIRKGKPCNCHANSAKLWYKNRNKIKIATGYALPSDGMWRQHTWCVKVGVRKNRIIETTTPRIAYFGFVLTEEESEAFYNKN